MTDDGHTRITGAQQDVQQPVVFTNSIPQQRGGLSWPAHRGGRRGSSKETGFLEAFRPGEYMRVLRPVEKYVFVHIYERDKPTPG